MTQHLFNVPGVGELAPGRAFAMTLQFTNEETGEPYLDTVKFPANFLENATEEDLARLGITIVPVQEQEPAEPPQEALEVPIQEPEPEPEPA